jgi:uncharacterized phage infection (PIP) family protein YhgE
VSPSKTKAELASELAVVQEQVAQLSQENERLQALVDPLIEINRQQAEALEAANQRLALLEQAGQEAPPTLMGGLPETEPELLAAAAQVADLSQANEVLQQEVSRLSGQLAQKGEKPLLGAPQVSNMISDLYQELSRSLPGMNVRESDLTLRFAMQPAGEQAGFQLFGVEPGQESGPVSELHIKMDRRGRPSTA